MRSRRRAAIHDWQLRLARSLDAKLQTGRKMGRALALLLPLCAALPHRHDVHSILDEIRALKSDIDADESPTLERRVYSNDDAAEEAEQHDDALASAPELEAGTAAAPNENAQWVTSMQIAVDNLKGDIVAAST